MEEKDKEFEISIDTEVGTGSLKLKNFKNRVVASIGDIIVDQLSYFRWNNTLKFLDKYNRKRARRKLEGKETPLPPKFILEVLENAIQEDNEQIQEQWCNMLINWQDIEKNCDPKYMYIDILKNLNINEIRLLKQISVDPNLEETRTNKNMYYDRNIIQNALHINDEEYELMVLNLFRLKVCDSLKSSGNAISVGNLPVLADAGIDKIIITSIGYNLIKLIDE